MLDILERQQVWIYCAAISLAAITGFAVSGTSELEGAINPALAFMLSVTFLQVPLPEIGREIRGARFLCTLLVSNFIAVPILTFLLAPCIDYMITGRGSGDAVLRTDADHVEHANEMGTPELH